MASNMSAELRQRRGTATGEVPSEGEGSSPFPPSRAGPAACAPLISSRTTSTDSDFSMLDHAGAGSPSPCRSGRQEGSGPRAAMSASAVRKDESKARTILIRVVYGAFMFAIFCGLVYVGHTYICALIVLIETLLFRELVRVRYSAYYETIQDTIPLFRTTQWLWFT